MLEHGLPEMPAIVAKARTGTAHSLTQTALTMSPHRAHHAAAQDPEHKAAKQLTDLLLIQACMLTPAC